MSLPQMYQSFYNVYICSSGLVAAYKQAVSAMVSNAAAHLQKHISEGAVFEKAWNKCSVYLVKCAEVHKVRLSLFDNIVCISVCMHLSVCVFLSKCQISNEMTSAHRTAKIILTTIIKDLGNIEGM